MTRIAFTIVALVVIAGTIVFLEGRKSAPSQSDTAAEEIRIEDKFAGEIENNEASETQVSTTTAEDSDSNSEEIMKTDETAEETVDTEETTEKPVVALTKTRAERIAEKAEQHDRAKEITTPDGFINTDGVTVEELVGEKIILIDFWTYSCINCQRTTPYLNAWHDKYADDGLVILGIHTPEFEFEKEYDNVKDATEKFGIEYPVILDNDYSTWGAYKNRYWPRKYLIDIDGFIVYDHIGEGAYDKTEEKIIELINEKNEVFGGSRITRDISTPEDIDEVDFSKVGTRETYLGSARMEYIANLPNEDCFGKECEFIAPQNISPNLFAFDGEWRIEAEESVLESNEGSL